MRKTDVEQASGADLADLESQIALHINGWAGASVELAIHGTADARAIAERLREFCHRELDVAPRSALFYRSSVGAVAGLVLEDGRRVVLKAYQPDRSRERLLEVVQLQQHLARAGCMAPEVLAGPTALGRGHGVIERYVERGSTRDGHEPAVREGIATALHWIVKTLEPFVVTSTLPPGLLGPRPSGGLWPKPHSAMFDLEATRAGAEEIDAIALRALPALRPAGRSVLGHTDWRAEHVHFEGDTPVAAFDWDSLCKESEAALVGAIAHAFCADWSRPGHVQAPTLDESRAFVGAYEQARGASFEAAERRLCGAAFAYGIAYSARCGHAIGKKEREQPGTFHHLIAQHGAALLDL